jgi:hypothetical protein
MLRYYVVFALGALAACGEDPPPASDTDACALLEMGPYTQITATTSRDSGTPAVADDGNAYTVTLTASGFAYVKLEATAGKHTVYLDRTLTVNALEGAGTPATLSSATSSGACTTIMGRHEVTFAAGTVYLGLMSDGGAPVNVVVAAP